MKTQITIEQAKSIVQQLADAGTWCIQSGEVLDTELLATRLLYQLEHPEVIPPYEDR